MKVRLSRSITLSMFRVRRVTKAVLPSRVTASSSRARNVHPPEDLPGPRIEGDDLVGGVACDVKDSPVVREDAGVHSSARGVRGWVGVPLPEQRLGAGIDDSDSIRAVEPDGDQSAAVAHMHVVRPRIDLHENPAAHHARLGINDRDCRRRSELLGHVEHAPGKSEIARLRTRRHVPRVHDITCGRVKAAYRVSSASRHPDSAVQGSIVTRTVFAARRGERCGNGNPRRFRRASLP